MLSSDKTTVIYDVILSNNALKSTVQEMTKVKLIYCDSVHLIMHMKLGQFLLVTATTKI